MTEISSPAEIMAIDQALATKLENTMVKSSHALLPIIMTNVRANIDLWRDGLNVTSLPKRPNTPCLPPNQLVNTSDGLKPINEVKVGDFVLTHKGRYRRVSRIMKRQYDGPLVHMVTKGGTNDFFATITTPDHPYLTRRLTHRKSGRIFCDFEWLEAEKIAPRTNGNQRYTPYLTLPRIKDTEDIDYVEHTLNYYGKSTSIRLSVTKDLMKMIGYYLAEGYTVFRKFRNRRRLSDIYFAFGKTLQEYLYASELVKSLKKTGFHGKISRTKFGYRVYVSSVKLASFLSNNFGRGSHNKHLPRWVKLLPPEKLPFLLKAYINGDGTRRTRHRYYSKRRDTYLATDISFTSVSLQLATDMRDIALKIGYNAYFMLGESKINQINDQKFKSGVFYKVGVSPRGRSSFLSDTDYQYLLPKKTLKTQYSGPVYNLEVDEDESYCTIMHTLHNCIVVGAGPTLWKKNHLRTLKKAKWQHAIFACDRMLIPLLKKGIIPDYVGTVDPRPILAKFYDDPIVDKYADEIKAVFPVSTHPDVVKKCPFEIYWCVPRMDEMLHDQPQSLTKAMHFLCDKGIVVTAGNTGTFCWALASGLHYEPIILIGFDLSYDTSKPEETVYYQAIKKEKEGNAQKIKAEFTKGYHPFFKTPFLIDTVFMIYRYGTLKFINLTGAPTINCTEGGSLYGGKVKCAYFKPTLKKYGGFAQKRKHSYKKKDSLKIALISTPMLKVFPDTYGGLECVVGDLAEALAEMGQDVTVFAPNSSKVKGCKVVEFGEPMRKVQVNWLEAERRAYEVYKDVLTEFGIIHSHDWFGFCYAAKAKNPNLKVLHTHHGGLNLSFWKRSPPPFKLNFIGISDWMVKVYASQGFTAKRVYNGIDLQKYKFRKRKGDRLLFLGRISKIKAPDVAVEVAKKAGLGLDVVGGTSFVDDPSYVDYVKGLCDGEQIKFVGEVDHQTKVKYLRNAKALLIPSRFGEPFGLIAVESLACGTVPIAFDDGALKEIIVDGKSGFICNSVEDMVSAINRVGRIVPKNCRKQAKLFSRERMATSYLKLYRQILAGNEF